MSLSGNNFCSRSCSASFNNRRENSPKRHPKINNLCLNCDKLIIKSYNKYCSKECEANYRLHQRLSNNPSSRTVKNFLLKTCGHVCNKCKLSEWNGLTIPIELEHIDGNSQNNSLDNVELLCPNCHAQTSTYKGKNKGNGRHKRMERYHSGKSY